MLHYWDEKKTVKKGKPTAMWTLTVYMKVCWTLRRNVRTGW